MADHTNFVNLAIRLINKQGRTIDVIKLSGAAADPTKPWKGPGAPTTEWSHNMKAVFLPATGTDFGQIITNKELLASVEQVTLIAPFNDVDLSIATVIKDALVNWKVEFVQVLKPADQVCLYAFGVKR